MSKIGIYKISSLHNDKIYIGSSKDINNRISTHKSQLRNNLHSNVKLQRFVNKYGLDSLIFEIIEECEIIELIIKEQHYIDTLKPFFNICKIAGRITHSQEFKDKLAEANRNRVWSDKGKEAISKANKGREKSDKFIEAVKEAASKTKSDEHKKKISESNKGKIIPEQTKKAVAEANRNRIISEETRQKLSEASKRRWAKNKE